jgi:hypothetical protein
MSVDEARMDAAAARYREHGWLAVADVWNDSTVSTSAELLDALATEGKGAAAERQLEAPAVVKSRGIRTTPIFDLPLDTPVVGVWIAIDAATLDNGCMHLLDGGHRAGPRPHFAIRDWQLCDAEMLGVDSVAVPLAPGGALFFDGLLPHGTPTNLSERRRRAVQLHFCPAGSRRVSKAERFSVFGDRGTFTC